MSLYGDYIQERLGKSIIEDENGFATYYFVNDGAYLEDVYVKPAARGTDVSRGYVDRVAAITIERGFKRLYSTVLPSAAGSTESIKVILANGFRLDSSGPNYIVFVKEL